MSEALERLDRRIAVIRRATLICAAVLAAAVAVLGGQLAFQGAAFLSSRHRLDREVARERRLSRAVASLPKASLSAARGKRLTPDATFVALAGHVGTLAQRTGCTVRTLKRDEIDTQPGELRPPAGEAEVVAQLHLDTTYSSGLEFLRKLGGLPLLTAPTEVDMESGSTASSTREPRLVLRLQLIAYGITPTGGD